MGRPRKVVEPEVATSVVEETKTTKKKKTSRSSGSTPQELAEKYGSFNHENTIEEKLATTYKIELRFTTPLLGTSPADPEIYRKYLGSRDVDADTIEEEIEKLGVDEALDNRMTVFLKDKNGVPLLRMHQIKGFLGSAAEALKRNSNSRIADVTSYKKKIKDCVFLFNDDGDLYFPLKFNGSIKVSERPCRTTNAHGDPQVFLNASEEIPAGATCTFNLQMLSSSEELCAEDIFELLDYGKYRGLLQWRNGGYGCFEWRIVSVTEAKAVA